MNTKRNENIRTCGLDDPFECEKVVQNIYYNYTHEVLDCNKKYIIRGYDKQSQLKIMSQTLLNEKISFQSDIEIDGIKFDFWLIHTPVLIQLYSSKVDSQYYCDIARKNNFLCYVVFPFDNIKKFVKSLQYKWMLNSNELQTKIITAEEAQQFYRKYSLYQLNTKHSINIGMLRRNDIILCGSFAIQSLEPGLWTTTGLCNKFHYSVDSGYEKILNFFISRYDPKIIQSFIDTSKSNGSAMRYLGFSQVEYINPIKIFTKNKAGLSLGYIQSITHQKEDEIIQMMKLSSYNMINSCEFLKMELKLA